MRACEKATLSSDEMFSVDIAPLREILRLRRIQFFSSPRSGQFKGWSKTWLSVCTCRLPTASTLSGPTTSPLGTSCTSGTNPRYSVPTHNHPQVLISTSQRNSLKKNHKKFVLWPIPSTFYTRNIDSLHTSDKKSADSSLASHGLAIRV